MKKLILYAVIAFVTIVLLLPMTCHAQNYLLQNKNFIVNKLIQEHAKFRNGYNNYGAQYIDVDETKNGIVSHKAYYLDAQEICIEYDIVTEDEQFFNELLNFLSASPNYTKLGQYKWSNYDNSATIIARLDHAQDGTNIFVLQYTVR